MEFTIGQLAMMLKGVVEGNQNEKVSNVGKIESAKKGDISFLANPKYENYIYTTNATCVIVSDKFEPKETFQTNLIKVEDPYSAFTVLLEEYDRILSFSKKGVEDFAILKNSSTVGRDSYRASFSYIGENCKIGNNVKIYPHVYIGDSCIIGDNTILYAGAKVYSQTIIGNNCVLHAGSVVGSDGFGFAPQADGTYKTIPQVGNVVIEDNVSIGANTTIDCATMGSTIIRKGVKIDNLVQIAHNVEVGENTVMAAQVAIAGSTKIGKNNVFGGQVGIGGHISIADYTQLGAKSGIIKTVKEKGQALIGAPAIPVKEFFKIYAIYKNLPEISKRIAELEEKTLNLTSI
jgi:UDP-3-O-[3-hydroxymyristoyl] glucosamine N-acyltransferase